MIDYLFSVVEVKSCENGAAGDIITFFLKLPKKLSVVLLYFSFQILYILLWLY